MDEEQKRRLAELEALLEKEWKRTQEKWPETDTWCTIL